MPRALSPQRDGERAARTPGCYRGGTRLWADGMVGAQLEQTSAGLLPYSGRSPDESMDNLAGFGRHAGANFVEIGGKTRIRQGAYR